MVSFTHEQNSICSQKQLNDIALEHTIICRQLFAGHVVGSRPMKRKKHLHRMIMYVNSNAIQSPPHPRLKFAANVNKSCTLLVYVPRLHPRIVTNDSMGSLLNFIYLKLNWSFS